MGLRNVGHPQAFQEAIELLNHGGRLALRIHDDVSIDWSQVVFKGLQIKGIYGREMYETWYKMTSMLQPPVITIGLKSKTLKKVLNC